MSATCKRNKRWGIIHLHQQRTRRRRREASPVWALLDLWVTDQVHPTLAVVLQPQCLVSFPCAPARNLRGRGGSSAPLTYVAFSWCADGLGRSIHVVPHEIRIHQRWANQSDIGPSANLQYSMVAQLQGTALMTLPTQLFYKGDTMHQTTKQATKVQAIKLQCK